MLTHEMIHLAFPSMADEHHWIEEGSPYTSSRSRAFVPAIGRGSKCGATSSRYAEGTSESGRRGNGPHTHLGRTYWGGALFCFVADVEIRKQTKNKKGLEDALRGILDAGGDINEDWELEKALKTGDEQWDWMCWGIVRGVEDKPVQVDLGAMWKKLGVEAKAERYVKDDAPLSAVRHAIETGTGRESRRQAVAIRYGAPNKGFCSPSRPLAVFAGRTAKSN